MISRLTACAACFAVVSAATITFAAQGPTRQGLVTPISGVPVVQLPRVEITGHRASLAPR
jgi:hypothetical protein